MSGSSPAIPGSPSRAAGSEARPSAVSRCSALDCKGHDPSRTARFRTCWANSVGCDSRVLDPQIVGLALEQPENGLESSTEVGGRRGTELEDGDQVFLEAVHPALDVQRLERRKMLQCRRRPRQALAAESSTWSGDV